MHPLDRARAEEAARKIELLSSLCLRATRLADAFANDIAVQYPQTAEALHALALRARDVVAMVVKDAEQNPNG